MEERTIARFKNVASGGIFNRTKITLCFEPESLSPSVLERFKRNPYFTDFYKENSSYIAEFGKDVNNALKVASYILSAVYYITPDIKLEYVSTKF